MTHIFPNKELWWISEPQEKVRVRVKLHVFICTVSTDVAPIGSPSVATATAQEENAMLTTANGAPDLGPQVKARTTMPLFSGVCPNIPQWALTFPAVR